MEFCMSLWVFPGFSGFLQPSKHMLGQVSTSMCEYSALWYTGVPSRVYILNIHPGVPGKPSDPSLSWPVLPQQEQMNQRNEIRRKSAEPLLFHTVGKKIYICIVVQKIQASELNGLRSFFSSIHADFSLSVTVCSAHLNGRDRVLNMAKRYCWKTWTDLTTSLQCWK